MRLAGVIPMIDTTTKKPIRVIVPNEAPASIDLPNDQVDTVSKILESNGIGFWVDHISISINSQPYVSTIHLRRGANSEQVQALLDAVP
jgi:hypothetical protein